MSSEMGTSKAADNLTGRQVVAMFGIVIGECFFIGGLLGAIFDRSKAMALIGGIGVAMMVAGYLSLRDKSAPPVAERNSHD